MKPKPGMATVILDLTYDAWKDLESALMERAIQAGEHTFMRDRLNGIRKDVETQVRIQRPRW